MKPELPGAASTGLLIDVGEHTLPGARARNEDYAACYLGTASERLATGVIAALSDGMGGAKGGRVAAELAVRSFIEAALGQPATLGMARIGSRAVGRHQPLDSCARAHGFAVERHGLHAQCTSPVRQAGPCAPCRGFPGLQIARREAHAAHARSHPGRARHHPRTHAGGGRTGHPEGGSQRGIRAAPRPLPAVQRWRAWRAVAAADPRGAVQARGAPRNRVAAGERGGGHAPMRTTPPPSSSTCSRCPPRSTPTSNWRSPTARCARARRRRRHR